MNAASSASGAVASGSIASVYGAFFPGQVSEQPAPGSPLPLSLRGLSIAFAGNLAPLYFATEGQANVQIPWELGRQLQALATAEASGQTSEARNVNLAPFAPGLFSMNGQGTGQGAILDSRYRLVDSSNPGQVGDVIQIYCTGLGSVANQPATGSRAPSGSLAETTTIPTVSVGGISPNSVGLYQINAQIPAGMVTGPAVPVIISLGGVASNTVTVAIQN